MTNFTKPLIAALLLLQACAPSQKIVLNHSQFKVGHSIVYRVSTNTTTTVDTPDGGQERSQKSVVNDNAYIVSAIYPDGSVDFEVKTLRRQSAATDRNGLVKRYDTDVEPDSSDMEAVLMRAIMHQALHMRLSANGKIISFSGMDEIWSSIEASTQHNPALRIAFKSIRPLMNDEVMREMSQEVWGYLPDKPVKKGKRWKKQRIIPVMGSLQTTYYQLKETSPGNLTISGTSNTEVDPKHPGELKVGTVKLQYFLNGEGTFEGTLDPATMWLQKSQQNLLFSGDMVFNIPTLAAQKVPANIQTTTTIERL